MQHVSGLILKSKDFQISGNDVIIKTPSRVPGMLLIHAEWCIYCKRFIPTFNELSTRLGKEFVCASIESEELKNADELVSALNFKGFPTICFFDQNGKISHQQYDGARDTQSMLNAICKLYHKCYM
jgi:thiol-disulfide isomerase/thioredoxin